MQNRKRFGVILCLGFWMVVFTIRTIHAYPFDAWQYNSEVTVQGYAGSETLTNFPILVRISTTAVSGFDYADTEPGGADLRFTAADRAEVLNHEIDEWNPGGVSLVWVQARRIADANESLYMYWGRAAATAPSYTTNGSTWSNGYVGVWHLSQNPTNDAPEMKDSSPAGNHGTCDATMDTADHLSARIGYGLDLDGTDDDIDCGNAASLMPANAISVQVWARSDVAPGAYDGILGRTSNSGWGDGYGMYLGGANARFFVSSYSGNVSYKAITATSWNHLVGTYDGSFVRLYANAVEGVTDDYAGTITASSQPLVIGNLASDSYNHDGLLDELQISSVARSEDWVWACWTNQVSNSSFVVSGAALPVGKPNISNLNPTNITRTSACLNGYLASTGTAATTVLLYYGDGDGGAVTSGLWKTTNTWNAGDWDVDSSPSFELLSLTSNTFHHYRYAASNSVGRVWDPTTKTFLAGGVWVTAPAATALEAGAAGSPTTVHRAGSATNFATTVLYGFGGTAESTDYTLDPAGNNLVLAVGQADADITISAVFDPPDSPETVVLFLSNGLYAVTSPASNTVTITEGTATPGTNLTTAAGNWNDDTKWTQNRRPIDGDTVFIRHSMVLAGDSAQLASFTITNAALTFTNWSTTLYATNVAIGDGGTLGLPAAFTSSQMSNRIQVACSHFVLSSGGSIDADTSGFAAGHGPGVGARKSLADPYGGGGAYGGNGGRSTPGQDAPGGLAYGSTSAPVHPGSGGGGYIDGGGGGGAVRIDADGTVTIDGTISANGGDASGSYYGGGGSGGGVHITCDTFKGSASGLISATGGTAGLFSGKHYSGGGGGGRIAVEYAALGSPHAARFATSPGEGWADKPVEPGLGAASIWWSAAEMGTLYLPDAGMLSETLSDQLFTDVRLVPGALTSWRTDYLTVSNCSLRFEPAGFTLTVTNDLLVGADGRLGVRGNLVTQNGNVVVTNGGTLSFYAAATNGTSPAYGSLVSVTGNVNVGASSWILPYNAHTNGGAVLFRMHNLSVAPGGGFDATARGFASQKGPGQGTTGTYDYGAGAGYGGAGGYTYVMGVPGGSYGVSNAPVVPGSGGGNTNWGGYGGGTVWIEASGTVDVDGTIAAPGGQPARTSGGGGSGGGISISSGTFQGSQSGLLTADGGRSVLEGAYYYAGGGGGGRIAVSYAAVGTPHKVRFSTAPGAGYADSDPYGLEAESLWHLAATPGTVYLPDTAILGETLSDALFSRVNLYIGSTTAWTPNSLTISNCSFAFGPTGFRLTVLNDIVIGAGGSLGLRSSLVTRGGDLVLTNGGTLSVYGSPTNGAALDYGALVSVTGNVNIGSGSWIYPYAHGINGGAVLLRMDDLTVASGGGINANAKGYAAASGPGKGATSGSYGGGGSYGGRGGKSHNGATPGPTNGLARGPFGPGSGSAPVLKGGRGGGAIRIEAGGSIRLDGTLSADGGNSVVFGYDPGGGSGGGITVMAARFQGGAGGQISANGGDATAAGVPAYRWAGGGGGGRIAVWYGVPESKRAAILAGLSVPGLSVTSSYDRFEGALSASNGLGWAELYDPGYPPAPGDDAEPGTAMFLTVSASAGTLILVR